MADAAKVNALVPSLSLEGKTAIVTGASRGIGRVIAETFALAGADVAIIARNREELNDVARVIRGNNRQAYVEVCDVSDVASVRTCVANMPVPDILVNNAA
jgi:NAD(P)-dependent dehydrogenase (short-subunit alcohol dehydrogenase family)